MENKIKKALDYYFVKQNEIIKVVNSKSTMTAEDIIKYGEEMAVLESKITALEVALES